MCMSMCIRPCARPCALPTSRLELYTQAIRAVVGKLFANNAEKQGTALRMLRRVAVANMEAQRREFAELYQQLQCKDQQIQNQQKFIQELSETIEN